MSENSFKLPEEVYVGGFKLLKYGSLLQEEQEWFEERELEKVNKAIPMLELAAEISKTQGISGKEALNAVQSFGDDENLAPLLLDHIEAVKELTETLQFEQRLPSRLATLMIQSRCSQDWLLEQEDNIARAFPKLKPLIDEQTWNGIWSESMTRALPTRVRDEIVSFAMGERRRWVELDENKTSGKKEEPSLGESSQASTKPKSRGQQTGKKSTGFSSKQD